MSLSFTNATGNIFNRLGLIIGGMTANQVYQGTTIPDASTKIETQFTTAQGMIPTFQQSISSAQSAAQSFTSALSNVASNVVVTMVQNDLPQPAASLTYALPELIRQMTAASATVVKNTVGGSVTAYTGNTGTGLCIISTTDSQGNSLENIYAEDITITCTSDALPGNGATPGQELFTARGDASVSPLAYNWPTGSGGTAQLTTVSADAQRSNQNVLINSNFETWTNTNTLSSWTAGVGLYGTNIVQQTASVYTGSSALQFIGNGSQLTQVYQNIRSSTSAGIVYPQAKYCLSVFTAVSSVPAAGVLRIALKDTVGGSVLGGVTITLSGETTSYARHYTTFNTPLALPSNLNLVCELTTALDNAKSVYIDELVLTKMVQFANGPYITVLRSNTNFIRGDYFTATTTNDRAGLFQTWFNRMFQMDAKGLLLPSAGTSSATIPNSLIQ